MPFDASGYHHFGATTFSIMTLSITTFRKTTLSLKGFLSTLSINNTQHKRIQNSLSVCPWQAFPA
jgi:hypothetical protein